MVMPTNMIIVIEYWIRKQSFSIYIIITFHYNNKYNLLQQKILFFFKTKRSEIVFKN